jgi:tetratricopeptide (TPR) repeat protein
MTNSKDDASRPRLTVVMIVRDEQETLAASVESVRTIADEILVVDLGSTDRTTEIALELGVMVNHYGWENDYSAARTHSLRQAEGDWVLWLEAGEQLSEESAESFRNFIDRDAQQQCVYRIVVQTPPDERSQAEQIAQIRLAPNNPDLRFEGRVRETIEPSVDAIGLSVDKAPGLIVCHARRFDSDWKASQAEQHLGLAALETADSDEPQARVLLAVGEAQAELGKQLQAMESFCKAIEAAERGSTEMLEGYYGLLTSCDGDPLQQDRQVGICLEALEIFPLDAQLLLAMGNYLQIRDQWDLAIRSFRTAVKHGQVDIGAWHLVELGEVAVACLSLCLQAKGSDSDALRTLAEGIERYGNSPRLLRHLLDLQVRHACCDDALATAGKLVPDSKQLEALSMAIRGACKATQRDWIAALGLLQSAYVEGCRDSLCLRWLSVVLLSNGQNEAAMPVLLEWQQIEPDNAELRTYLEKLQQPPLTPTEGATQEQPPEQGASGRVYRVDEATDGTPPATSPTPGAVQDGSKDSLSAGD